MDFLRPSSGRARSSQACTSLVKLMVQNSEDNEITVTGSQMAMEGVAVVAEPSTDDSMSYAMNFGKMVKLTYKQNVQAVEQIHADSDSELGLPRCEIDPFGIKKAGRSARKRRGHIVDELNLNVCLCGSVVNPSMEPESVVKCK